MIWAEILKCETLVRSRSLLAAKVAHVAGLHNFPTAYESHDETFLF